MPTTAAAPGAAHAARTTHCTVLVYAVPNTDLRVLVDGIENAADLVQAQEIAQRVLCQLAATPAAQRRSRVLRVDSVTDIPNPTPELKQA